MLNDKTRQIEARQAQTDKGALTVAKHRADGYTQEKFLQWKDDQIGAQAAMNARMTPEKIDDIEGHPTYHLKMNMPMILSNRSIITTQYETKDDEGNIIVINSSQGNEKVIEARKAQIGSDVVA